MEKNNFRLFKDKICKIGFDNGYTYTGYIKAVNDKILTFNDRYNGLMLIELETVKSISEFKENKNERDNGTTSNR